ncbi:MAG TPA: hypothetical protein VLH56_16985 [Dissulfurispiraceae bacterium]|nr:hypothetical protein [Dissulfurispiraceae bacterium]
MNIQQVVKRIVDEAIPVQVVAGKVESVDTGAMTCQVAIAGRPTRYEVRLRAVVSDQSGFVAIPKAGSMVLIALIDNLPQSSFVVAAGELEKLQVSIQDSYLEITAQGMVMRRGSGAQAESLKKLLADTYAAIQALTVTTPAGPSGAPINIAEFANLNTRLNNLLTE